MEYVDILKKGKTAKLNNPVQEENINISGIENIQEGLTNNLQEYEINENKDENKELINQKDTDEELKFLFGINNSEDLFI